MNATWRKRTGLNKIQRRNKLLKLGKRSSLSESRTLRCVLAIITLVAVLVGQSGSFDAIVYEVSLSSTSWSGTNGGKSTLFSRQGESYTEHSTFHSLKDNTTPLSSNVSSEQAATTNTYPKDELRFIPSSKLQEKDYFSGSFFVSRDTFLHQLKPRHFIKLESASLEASRNPRKAKMLMDWTALCVEHFSHWWKTLYRILEYITREDTSDNSRLQNITVVAQDQQRLLMQHMVEMFLKYIQMTAPRQWKSNLEYHEQLGKEGGVKKEHPMQRTIAAIAFQPYRLPINATVSSQTLPPQIREELEGLLTVHSLAATIASMVSAGFGRILVVGYQQPLHEFPSVQKAFGLVKNAFKKGTIQLENPEEILDDATTGLITTTSLGYVAITDETWVRNYRRKNVFNLQMGVITGLQIALKGYMKRNVTRQQEWLGKELLSGNTVNEYWKYVFLTEPDLLLHTKPWVLELLAKGMDNDNLSFFPHRLQPLPHQSDFAKFGYGLSQESKAVSSSDRTTLLPGYHSLYSYLIPNDSGAFSKVTTLDDSWSCCDELSNDYPGRSREFGWRQHQVPCEDWWWTCGYVHNRAKVPTDSIENDNINNNSTGSHARLERYPMLRLEGGSGIVFGSTEQGRRCTPRKRPCQGTLLDYGTQRTQFKS